MKPRFSEHKYPRFRRNGTKSSLEDGLRLEWVQKEAQSLTFKITKMAAVWIYNFPHKNNVNCRKMGPRFSEHKSSRFRRIGTKFGVVGGLGLECVQKEAQRLPFKITKIAAL